MAQDPGRGTLLLVLGILSIVCCALLGPVAWIMGKQDLAKIRNGEIAPEAEQMTKIGMILGIVGTVILCLNILGGCAYAVIVVIVGIGSSKVKTSSLDDVFQAIGCLFC
jgi:ABC-type Fe3+ transport system permease subunit